MTNPLPHYTRWANVPENLLTVTALSQAGLLPGGGPVATVTYYGNRQTVLYDRTHAVPKPARTPAQQQGVLLAAQTREEKRVAAERAAAERSARSFARRRSELCDTINADRADAHATFRRWANDPGAVVIDTETTGLDGQVIEVGVCTVAGEPILDQRVRVPLPIEPGAFAVHGISDADLRGYPGWDEVWPRLEVVLGGRTVLAFNAAFDERCLELSVHHLFPPERFAPKPTLEGGSIWPAPLFNFSCVMAAYAVWNADYSTGRRTYRWKSLDWATAGLDLPPRGPHGALDDAFRTAALIRHVAGLDLDTWSPADLPDDWV